MNRPHHLTDQAYGPYAVVYDRTGQLSFSVIMHLYLTDVLTLHVAPGKRLLDLACGTGSLALMFAATGWDVIGLDRSVDMLAQAREKQRASETVAQFVEGDLRAFMLPGPVDLVTCFYDSLNYLLLEDELASCFASVAQVLVPGGLWCFDMATEYFLREYWQGIDHYQDPGYCQTTESSYDARSGYSTLVLNGRLMDDAENVREFWEVHVERSFAPALVERCLVAAGLQLQAWYDCFTFQAPNARSLRHFWVARKVS